MLPYLAFIPVTDNCLTTKTLTKKYCGHESDSVLSVFHVFKLLPIDLTSKFEAIVSN